MKRLVAAGQFFLASTRTTWLLVTLLVTLLPGCDRGLERTEMKMTGGDPHRGKAAIRRYGCGACHQIPGIPGATGEVGPSLEGVGTRAYVAGILPNIASQMILWIQYPQNVDPRKAMPNLDVSEKDARDIAAYLYSLTQSTPLR